MTSLLWKRLLGAALLAGMLLAVPSLEAQPRRNRCEQRIRQAEYNLQKAIRRHGPRSRQAAHRRRELDVARERCGAL